MKKIIFTIILISIVPLLSSYVDDQASYQNKDSKFELSSAEDLPPMNIKPYNKKNV